MSVSYSEALGLIHRDAISAINRVSTWVHHPSFDSKTDMIAAFRHTTSGALMAQRLFGYGHVLPEAASVGIDWNLWFCVREAVEAQRGSDRDAVKKALDAFWASDLTFTL